MSATVTYIAAWKEKQRQAVPFTAKPTDAVKNLLHKIAIQLLGKNKAP